MEPMLEPYWDGLGVGRIGEAKFDSGSIISGLNICGGSPMSETCGLGTSGGAGGLIISWGGKIIVDF